MEKTNTSDSENDSIVYMMAQKLGVPIDLVVKFGGSAITDKHQLESLRKDNLVSAAATISHCVDHGLRCVVVHGAGSFGHHHAKDYEVNSGLHGTAEEVKRRKYGMCLTRLSVTKLNHEVVRSLVDVKVNAIGMSAIGVWVADNGEIFRHGVNGILELLDNGFVPVLHGDCVLDASKGCGILSGDVIIKTLCKEHLVNRVVFLSDVTGVFDKPPSETDAKHIPKICVDGNGRIMSAISTSCSQHDVTGGMLLKIRTATDIVTNSGGKTNVYIAKVGSNSVNAICLGQDMENLDQTTLTEIVYQT